MSPSKRVVVIGADAAGMSAAHQALRGADKRGIELDVIVLESTQHTSYSACGIPYWIAGDVDDSQRLLARSAVQHREMGVDLRMGVTATPLDLTRRHVDCVHVDGAPEAVPFDELVLATGAPAVSPLWAGNPDGSLIQGMNPVKNLDDGATWLGLIGVDSHLGKPPRRRQAVVVGGGYIGV